MKMTLALTAILALSNLSARADQTPAPTPAPIQSQSIDCTFQNPGSTDHVIVSLTDPQNGTFYYNSGASDDDSNHTGMIPLKRQADKDQSAQFLARWSAVQDGSSVTVEFHFSMPKNLVSKTSSSFKGNLVTNIIDGQSSGAPLSSTDDLNCTAKLYSK